MLNCEGIWTYFTLLFLYVYNLLYTSSAEANNAWSYTSVPSIRLNGVVLIKHG